MSARVHAPHPDGIDARTGRPKSLCGLVVTRGAVEPVVIDAGAVDCLRCMARDAGDPQWRRAGENPQ